MKKILFLIITILITTCLACCNHSNGTDRTDCHISLPQPGAAFMPQDSIVVNAEVPDGTAKVRFYLDSAGLTEVTGFPYKVVIAPRTQKVGRHTLVAIAENSKGEKVSDTTFFFIGIGVERDGGIIFDLDSTGEHGLIAAKEDLPGTYPWETSGVFIGANDPDNGAANTEMIMAYKEKTSKAVKACANYKATVNGTQYDGWYMPATNELVKMYENLYLNHIGNFGAKFYWASTEMRKYDSYTVFFYDGAVARKNKYVSCSVRPIKAF